MKLASSRPSPAVSHSGGNNSPPPFNTQPIFNIMAKATTAKKPKATVAPTTSASPNRQRLWLMYPPKLIKEPLVWKLGHKFNVITNLRQASVTDEIGVVCLELDGKRSDVQAAIDWLEKTGVNVEPVEMSSIAG